jgi:hypothetical protein
MRGMTKKEVESVQDKIRRLREEAALFAKMDKNNDGRLSNAEIGQEAHAQGINPEQLRTTLNTIVAANETALNQPVDIMATLQATSPQAARVIAQALQSGKAPPAGEIAANLNRTSRAVMSDFTANYDAMMGEIRQKICADLKATADPRQARLNALYNTPEPDKGEDERAYGFEKKKPESKPAQNPNAARQAEAALQQAGCNIQLPNAKAQAVMANALKEMTDQLLANAAAAGANLGNGGVVMTPQIAALRDTLSGYSIEEPPPRGGKPAGRGSEGRN